MAGKDYIFQLTREDLRKLFAGANPQPGFCVRIDNTTEGIKIGVDENALKLAINGFIRNGGGTASAANCINIPFDPPS